MSNIHAWADTWNDGGTTFYSDNVDVTDGASGSPVAAAASRVRRNTKDGVETWSVDIDGCTFTKQPTNADLSVWDVAPFDDKPSYVENIKSYLWPGNARYNHVYRQGFNYADDTRVSGEVSVGIAFESFYYIEANSVAFAEGYWEYISADGSESRRPFGFRVNQTTNAVDASLQFTTLQFLSDAGVNIAGWASNSGFYSLSASTSFPKLLQLRNTSNSDGGWSFQIPGSGQGARAGDLELLRGDGNFAFSGDLTTGAFNFQYGIGLGKTPLAAAFLSFVGGTTAKAPMNLASGVAPTSPANGDIWFDGTDIKMRIGGATKTFTLT